MKKYFYLMGLMLCMVFGSMAFVACDDDDEEGGGNASITADQIIGCWYGIDENNDTKINVFSINFEPNGYCMFDQYKAKSKNSWQIEEEGYDMTWVLSKGTVVMTLDGYEGEEHQMKADLLSLNGNSLKIRRYLDEGDSDVMEMVRCDTPQDARRVLVQLLEEKFSK